MPGGGTELEAAGSLNSAYGGFTERPRKKSAAAQKAPGDEAPF